MFDFIVIPQGKCILVDAEPGVSVIWSLFWALGAQRSLSLHVRDYENTVWFNYEVIY